MVASHMFTGEYVVAVNGLSRNFGVSTAVSGVSIGLARGEVIGLVGANGGGKSTTLRILAGLLKPTSGNGTVLGRDVMRPERADRAQIGYMTQSLALYPELTVAENLRFRSELTCGDAAGNSARVVELYGLRNVMKSRVSELSGGWARRVQFAASVIHQPALLLLDEPTAGLDAGIRRDMWRWIAELAAWGCGVVVSTHDMHEAEQCPRILHFRDDEVEGPLPPGQLMQRTRTKTLEAAIIAEARR
jgi:ABC-2 type transport system ATP-binding protein